MVSPVDGKNYSIHIDFLCDKCELGYLIRSQPDLEAFMFEGADIAFDYNFEKEIEATLPGNGVDSTVFRVLDLPGSLILKGQALQNRRNLKDAYDIFALTHYGGGPGRAAQYFNRTFAEAGISGEKLDLARNSLAVIQKKFRDGASSGSFGVETFSENQFRRAIVAAQIHKFLENVESV